VLEADAYARDIIPKARGDAARVLEDARAYRDRVIADAEGEAGRFEALLIEYQKAPEVTRERLYIDAIEEVYGRSNKVFIDSEGSGNLLYLPIDQLMQKANRPLTTEGNRASDSPSPQQQRNDALSDSMDSRERRTRDDG
jgi:membrane protease subunit HflK